MARTKTRPRRNRHLNKAISAGIGQAIATGNTGLIPQRMGLMDAINIATNRNRLAGFWGMRELPRDPLDDVPFGPNQPLTPEPIDPPNSRTGMPDPRIWEYQQSWNLPGNARREVPWQVLRASAIGVDIIRRCIEGRKKHVRTLQWSWSVRAQVVEDAYGRETRKGYEDVAAELRDRYAADINRLTEFWQHPWRTAPAGPWSFGQWINSVMEEYLTLDAICIYPRRSLAGDLIALEQVDGATIKPLLDHRGAMPQPPHPAYQQELFGFPRGEFAASFTVDEQGRKIIDNGYQVGELHYHRENTRVHSPYGLSAVEQALISARLYLKRQGWLLAEYDDGSTPLTMMEPPLDPALVATFTPEQRRMWEDAYNAEYAGQTAARHRIKVAPPGWKPHQLSSADERYKPAFDLHLIKLVAGHFGMTATELGFSEQQGLGSAGWAETQAEVQGRIGLKPDTQVLADIVNAVSRDFCNAPLELEFSFVDPASANDAESDQVATSQRTRGTITLNQDRRALKLPLYDFKEADMPFLVTATGPVFLEGAYERVQQQAEAAQMQAQATVEGTTGKLELEQAKLEDGRQAREEQREFTREQIQAQADVEKAAAVEIAAYRTWRRRNPNPKRPFVFKAAAPDSCPDVAGLAPDVAQFDGWAWVADELLKYESWWPRDARGRWVKRSHLGSSLTADIVRRMSDDELFSTFHRLSQADALDEDLMQRLIDDMDRRERGTPFEGLADEDMTDEQRRVDELVTGGRDYLSAYAEVHGMDEGKLVEEAATSGLDRRPGETKHEAIRRSYDEWLHVTFLQAEKATHGNMLNRAGRAAGVNPLDLFTGPISRARRYGSEELQRWWRRNQRLNFTQFRAQLLGREADARAAEKTRMLSNARDFI